MDRDIRTFDSLINSVGMRLHASLGMSKRSISLSKERFYSLIESKVVLGQCRSLSRVWASFLDKTNAPQP